MSQQSANGELSVHVGDLLFFAFDEKHWRLGIDQQQATKLNNQPTIERWGFELFLMSISNVTGLEKLWNYIHIAHITPCFKPCFAFKFNHRLQKIILGNFIGRGMWNRKSSEGNLFLNQNSENLSCIASKRWCSLLIPLLNCRKHMWGFAGNDIHP